MPHLHLTPLLGVPIEILIKIAIFHAAPAFDAPVRGPHRNTAIMLCMEKLEWCGYPMVKKWKICLLVSAAAAAAAAAAPINVMDYSAAITQLWEHFTKSRSKTVAQLNADVC